LAWTVPVQVIAMAARKPKVDNNAAMDSSDWRSRMHAVVEKVHLKVMDVTLCKEQGAKYRDDALRLFLACQRAKAWLAAGHEPSADVLMAFDLFVRYVQMPNVEASTNASQGRQGAKNTEKALATYDAHIAAGMKRGRAHAATVIDCHVGTRTLDRYLEKRRKQSR
jgi:hypothetical protein